MTTVSGWRRRVLRGFARASLRSRVLLLAVSLLAVGLVAMSVVVNSALRGYLEQRLDTQLSASAKIFGGLPPAVVFGATQINRTGGALGTSLFGDPTVTYLTADGTVEDVVNPPHGQVDAGPALPQLDTAAVSARGDRPFTVASRDGEERWRAVALSRGAGGGSVVVSIAMNQVDGTINRMRAISLATGLALLGVLAALGWFAVRSGLRPLSRIEETAAAIASGDLSRRVPDLAAAGTEVGRLTAALNVMLVQIETSFAARAESEARMGRFVADAGHELRTPLVGIKGFTDLYRMGALPERQDVDRTMAHIARESERLAGLVEDMLLLARLDERSLRTSGDNNPGDAFPLELAPMDLRTLAADALHDVRALDPSRPVELTGPGGGAPSSAPAFADEARLRQVVTNLVGNAVAHTPAATPIRIGVGTLGEHSVLEVADQGQGLTPEQGRRIFERFYRADGSRSRTTGGGAGLGLAIVRSLVTAHGGQVELLSAPGQGATFRMLLPHLTDHG
ncbi:MAG: two-component system, OmpR family, sensor kinase [Streptomyces sp.]|jgi:two-component system OmpR family sensor kinase|nr:two-component system, OmpR family, sensor kinase [Streptomyces sp.]